MKNRLVRSLADLDDLERLVSASATKALAKISQLAGSDALRAIWDIKFRPIGCDPLNSESELNLFEQINQSFTYLASIRAAKILIDRHSDLAPFTLNLGTAGGSDIESRKGVGLAAEVFAAVSPSNNRKLQRDIAKVAATDAGFKYVFFMCPDYEAGSHFEELGKKWGVEVRSVGATL